VPNSDNGEPKKWPKEPMIWLNEIDESANEVNGNVTLNAADTNKGIIRLMYKGDNPYVRVHITIPDGTVYEYAIVYYDTFSFTNEFVTFPLTGGDGEYDISVFEVVDRTKGTYTKIFFSKFDVAVEPKLDENGEVLYKAELVPFLPPNTYVNFSAESKAIQKAVTLIRPTNDEMDVINDIYDFVINNIKYDTSKVEGLSWPYIPDIDVTLETGKGICFDYASLMASMLRSQGIPTKLVFGYVGSDAVYHAWISCWTAKDGWLEGVIQFNGQSWNLADPTFGAGASNRDLKRLIGDGSKYDMKFMY